MSAIEFIRPKDRVWSGLLDQARSYDFYHLPAYHEMAEVRGEGEANLCVFRHDDCTIAIPLMLRQIKDVPGLEDVTGLDATSVYGYPGPLVSQSPSAAVVQRFQAELKDAFEARNVVSVFSRLNPLLPYVDCLRGLGQVDPIGPTVSINLRLTEEEQLARYRSNHMRDINRLRREEVLCFHDIDFEYIHEFIELYQETMRRVEANGYYLFDQNYFDQLRVALGGRLHLYLCRHEGRVICGGMFVHTGHIVQYHLGGTDGRYLRWAPMKLLFDTVRRDFSGGRASWFHLGGGVGGRRDSLFHFKRGFGGDQLMFSLWKWVVQKAAYGDLCDRRAGGPRNAASTFFPEYRA